MAKKKCSVPGCERISWVDGLCHKHYTEKNGEYTPKKKYLPREKKDPIPAETKRARSETKTPKPESRPCEKRDVTENPAGLDVGDAAVIVRFTGHNELLQNLRALAKKEFRNVDDQILYVIDQYFRRPEPILSPTIGYTDHPGVRDA